MKKKAKERQKEGTVDDTDPKLIIPALARVENKSYKPGEHSCINVTPVLRKSIF